MKVKYNKVVEIKESYHPLYDYKKEHPDEEYTDVIFISDHVIQFYTPLGYDSEDDGKMLINLKRDDSITGYTNHLEEPLWKVVKEDDGTITLWPSIIWCGSDPKTRQHFWFRNNQAIVLNDSWIFR